MWILTALLILVGWTAAGFVAALLFFRLGVVFQAPPEAAERSPHVPEPALHRHRAADPGYALTLAPATTHAAVQPQARS